MTAATAYAKINLALHVRRRRADGYHDIETIFAFAEHGDLIAATPGAARLTLTGPFAGALAGEDPEDNLVMRAARRLATLAGREPPAITLDKRLPVAAGIGGGSADAAAVLRLLCGDFAIAPGDPRVAALAADLGADVPACLASVTLRGDGRGDALLAVETGALTGAPLLLVNPRVALATGPVFKAWDGVDRGPLSDGDPLIAARAGRNDLEPPARALCPVIGDVVAALAAQPGVILARMSGSGATCFALFETMAARDIADRAIATAQPDWWRMASTLR
ncbi:4-diphosphocytidyl-2C-methyl-D-erythritol kinase [Sphingomonas sp. Root710]|uniref:4-(cytidine 5'-diphospho)-2-C-methyl-D-erythritol kinase n=1 Tax=Sphingomonas sp. Root710 TaxID=1736594 RepID=UPI0006F78975|nr:4-(cytidine 5'-diphospho)-2-C-methyl-D-erythritol kinase [Sphingomonas sp. Root710]KRB81221.1 4-diphosphocytidyl-2C-methyl-D-erythritol kinase [Sphingomonas sp. Root710]